MSCLYCFINEIVNLDPVAALVKWVKVFVWEPSIHPSTGLALMEHSTEPSASDQIQMPRCSMDMLRNYLKTHPLTCLLVLRGHQDLISTTSTTSTPPATSSWRRWSGSCPTVSQRVVEIVMFVSLLSTLVLMCTGSAGAESVARTGD